jgi:hypothetical protein
MPIHISNFSSYATHTHTHALTYTHINSYAYWKEEIFTVIYKYNKIIM